MTYPSKFKLAVVLFAIAAVSAALADQEWPQWRGPLASGASPDANPPVKWSETENIKWKIKLPGRGTSTPIVWGDKIFIQTAIATGKKVEPPASKEADAPKEAASANQTEARRQSAPAQRGDTKQSDSNSDAKGDDKGARGGQRRGGPGEFGGKGRGDRGGGRGGFGRSSPPPSEVHQFVLMAIDRATGKTIWQKVAREEVPHEGTRVEDHGFASHSPATDGEHIIAYFGSRGLHCYDMDGNLKWQKDLGRMRVANTFGEGASPALHGNAVVVNWDHEGDDFIAAFDKATGNELWRTPRDEGTTWSTPFVVVHDGRAQVITAATNRLRSYDLATGQQLWEADAKMTRNVIPSPVGQGDMVYLTSGFKGASLSAIRLGGSGDISGTKAIVWQHGKDTPYVPSPLLYENRLYFFSANRPELSCFDATTGEPVVPKKRIGGLDGTVYASPVAAAGRIYLVNRNGTTVVIKHATGLADDYEILATNQLDEGIEASPALAGNELFLRGQESLYCISEK
jgi:outer membrane protein assembly factor BamB